MTHDEVLALFLLAPTLILLLYGLAVLWGIFSWPKPPDRPDERWGL